MEEFELNIPTPSQSHLTKAVVKDFYKNRRIVLNDAIDDSILETVILYILKWNAEDSGVPADQRKPILIILNSYGGDKILGLGLIDTIRSSETPVKCLIVSMAASMASYIPMVCTETYAFPNAVVCMHDGSLGIMESARKASDTFRFYQAIDQRANEIVLKYTLLDEDFLEEIADREYYIFADEAKRFGIVDKIIGEDCTLPDVFQ